MDYPNHILCDGAGFVKNSGAISKELMFNACGGAIHRQDSNLSAVRRDSEKVSELYQTIRRMFTQKINANRAALKEAHIAEPVIMPTEKERIEHWNAYGSALRVLYQFKPDAGAHPFLKAPPNLGNVRRIDLKKIAFEPTAAYLQFLLNWENSLFDIE